VNPKRIYLPAAFAAIIVLILYFGFIRIGPWRERGYTSDYYSQQASAFRHGQIALETRPDPALLALPNLYDPKARKGIPLIGDASVYKGNYYLYFGGLPSLVLALLPVSPGDQFFTYFFIVGIFIIQSLLFIAIVRRYFHDVPGWILFLGILLLGLTGPFTRMLAHPYIHEAAISGGQFFSILGLYFAFRALQSPPADQRNLFGAGIFWSCAIGTRITQLIPIAVMTALTLLIIYKEYRISRLGRQFARATAALIAPLLVTGIVLAWYNWARFETVFEFGLYYQLAAFDLQANYSALFSRVYIVQNIYNYFFNPFELKGAFPFANSLAGSETSILAAHELPKLYIVEGNIAGILNSTPLLVFAIIPVIVLLAKFIRAIRSSERRTELFNHFDWTVLTLLGSFVAGSIPTLLIFYVGYRYETEFISGLTLLALTGFCQVYACQKNVGTKKAISLIGAVLGTFSLLLNLALALSGIRG